MYVALHIANSRYLYFRLQRSYIQAHAIILSTVLVARVYKQQDSVVDHMKMSFDENTNASNCFLYTKNPIPMRMYTLAERRETKKKMY